MGKKKRKNRGTKTKSETSRINKAMPPTKSAFIPETTNAANDVSSVDKSIWYRIFRNGENIGALISIPVSIIAIVLSLIGLNESRQINLLMKREFEGQRRLILELEEIPGDLYALKPVQKEQQLQKCEVIYPDAIDYTLINPKNHSFPIWPVQSQLITFLNSLDKPAEETFSVLPEIYVPAVFICEYTAKGEHYVSAGLYFLIFSGTLSGSEHEKAIADFFGMRYIRDVGIDEDIPYILNQLWQQTQSHIKEITSR